MRIAVVLPAPFGPRSPATVPGSTTKSIASTAVKSPNRFVSRLATTPPIRCMGTRSGDGGSGMAASNWSGTDADQTSRLTDRSSYRPVAGGASSTCGRTGTPGAGRDISSATSGSDPEGST